MSSTKIINVLKDDKFDELLDLVKNTDASEIVFVLPKNTRAFKSEGHFVVLADEAKDSGKSISFLCSNPEVNELAKKYGLDVLSAKTESGPLRKAGRAVPAQLKPVAVPVVSKNDDDLLDEEEEGFDKDEDEDVDK